MTPSLQELRTQLDSLELDDFLNLCQDSFPTVYTKFGEGMNRAQQTRKLLEHVTTPAKKFRLLEAIRQKQDPGSKKPQRKKSGPRNRSSNRKMQSGAIP
jgi:hypothetical protein